MVISRFVKESSISFRAFSTRQTLKQAGKALIQEELKNLKLQAPNRNVVWSQNQAKRQDKMVGPRFEQTDFQAQPFPPAAIELVKETPITFSDKRVVSCEGGEGPLGHPKVYINLDPGTPVPCGYCGLRFQIKHHH